jgi:esterase
MKGSLAIAPVAANGAAPGKWIVFLHGILGSGANWRSFARQIVLAKPHWGALLVDLRLHGESLDFDPPHTIVAAARDVVRATSSYDVRAILGHSFGGKVGLELARQIASTENGAVDDLFVVDSTPGARPDARGSSGVRHVVELLTRLPERFPDRKAFGTWVEERGVDRPTAMWLAMNVRPREDGAFVFRIDVPSVRVMMDDYFHCDLWDVLEHPPEGEGRRTRTHLIAGGKSDVLDAADLARGRVSGTVDVISNAGHWVHVDAPDALREVVLGYLE